MQAGGVHPTEAHEAQNLETSQRGACQPQCQQDCVSHLQHPQERPLPQQRTNPSAAGQTSGTSETKSSARVSSSLTPGGAAQMQVGRWYTRRAKAHFCQKAGEGKERLTAPRLVDGGSAAQANRGRVGDATQPSTSAGAQARTEQKGRRDLRRGRILAESARKRTTNTLAAKSPTVALARGAKAPARKASNCPAMVQKPVGWERGGRQP